MRFFSAYSVVILFFLGFLSTAPCSAELAPSQAEDPSEHRESFKDKFDRFNKKAEKFFVYVPAPIYSYSPETGSVYGLAKMNIIDIYPTGTGTTPTNIHGLASFSTLGHVNFYVGTRLYLHADAYFWQGGLGYRYFPEYIRGLGNQPSQKDVDAFILRQAFTENIFYKGLSRDHFLGFVCNVNNYLDITIPDKSYLNINDITGKDGGWSVGLGLSYLFDSRDNRYNASSGYYFNLEATSYQDWAGSDFIYNHFVIDVRKYMVVYRDQVVAFQLYSEANQGDVPFFSLAKLGGSNRMRGYYEGAIRDKVILDSQVEYRLPLWNIIGMTAWLGTGRVADSYGAMEAADFWFSYGLGLRFMIDSKNKTNLRLEFGFGEEGYRAIYANFSEAF